MQKERLQFENLPLDRMMDPAQRDAYLKSQGTPAFLALGELRDTPLHSPTEIPLRWQGRPNGDGFSGTAQPGEYYAFQVGVYAAAVPLQNLRASWSDLVGPSGSIPAGEITCFALEGTDCRGRAIQPRVDVASMHMQPLWFGVMLPPEGEGVYCGSVCVWGEEAPPVTVPYQIEVSGPVLADHGDSEPWRHSRLRWLNSTLAIDDAPTAPFGPVTLEDGSVGVLGRRIALGEGGLPAQLLSRFAPDNETLSLTETPVLAAPMSFEVVTDGGTLTLCGGYDVVEHREGVLGIRSTTTDGNLSLDFRARFEFDGYAECEVTVSAKTPVAVEDIRLSIPYTAHTSRYWMGLGQKGGLRKNDLDWKWDATLNQDTLWMGAVNAGLMVRLKDETYQKPYLLVYYHYSPLRVPGSWGNGGQGGVQVKDTPCGAVFTAYSGGRTLLPEQPQHFLFDLTVTPVKPIDKNEHWNDRYVHKPTDDLKAVARSGANIINLHHANRYNPFINYPFWETQRLADYVRRCHQNSLRVKLYYTVKEQTVRAPEFWAFKSLGEEILPSTYETGESFQGKVDYADRWLETYVQEKYITAWRQRVDDGDYVDEMEASVMHAPMSRFNNYYLEGLQWLLQHTGMDGLYFDDVAFDRSIMKRIRKILDRHHPGCTIDLHSWNYFANNTVDNSRLAGWGNSMNLYIDNFAFVDRVWFGEGFDYSEGPDYWLVEVSGIPFGMMGEMLQGGGNVYRGMVFGMSYRVPELAVSSGIWRLWHDFDIRNATMLGYWHPDCPVQTGHEDILCTVYRKADACLIALASWSGETRQVALAIDWKSLGLDPARCQLRAPAVEGFQEALPVSLERPIPIAPEQGCILWLTEQEGEDEA